MLQPLKLPEPQVRMEQVEQAEPAEPRWGFAQRVLFRFAFAYFLLAMPTYLTYFLPSIQGLATMYWGLWNVIVRWTGGTVLQVDTSVLPNGSGDTTYNYVQVFCFLMLALAATGIWTLLDRRRVEYVRLHAWLRAGLRFALAFWMFQYGAVKVIPLQGSSLSIDRLLQPFGDSSPESLFWTFLRASDAYTIFSGIAEMLGGLLLATRRTTPLGALVCCAVLLHVVMVNFSYDVPVKLFSLQLLAMAVFLLLPELGRLASLLVFNRHAEPAALRPLFANKWLHRSALVLRAVFFFGLPAFLLLHAHGFAREIASSPKPPLYGLWSVEEFILDGQARPPLFTDAARWRWVVLDKPRVLAILTPDTRLRFALDLNPQARTMKLIRLDDPGEAVSALSYQRLTPDLLTFEGTLDGHRIQARMRRAEIPEFRLVSRGFHWINEVPYSY